MKEKNRIMILEDHILMREGLHFLVNSQEDMEVCGEAGSIREAWSQIEKALPEVILVDIGLPGENGLEFIKDLKAQGMKVKTLVVSAHEERDYAERAIRAGAMGYVSKLSSGKDLLAAIRKILAGEIVLSHEIMQRMVYRMRDGKPDSCSIPDLLSDRELAVFELIGKGMKRNQIASSLHISPKTVQVYQEHIKNKLGLKTSVELHQRAHDWVRGIFD